MPYFNLQESDKNNEWYFNLKAGNNKTILASQGYTIKANAINGIESVKTNSQFDSRFVRLLAKNGQFYFNLKAANGQVIGTSEHYQSEAGSDKGVESVKKNAPIAEIKE